MKVVDKRTFAPRYFFLTADVATFKCAAFLEMHQTSEYQRELQEIRVNVKNAEENATCDFLSKWQFKRCLL